MAKIKISKRALLEDLAKRVYLNENGVKSFLAKAGITIDEGKCVTISDLQQLSSLNVEAFNNMIVFLYPELFNQQANTDGGEPDPVTASEKGMSAEDKERMFNLFNEIVNTSGDVLNGIFGNSPDNSASAAYAQLSKDMKIILVVAGIFALIITGVLIYSIKTKK